MSTPYGPPAGDRSGREPSADDQQWSAAAPGPAVEQPTVRQPAARPEEPSTGPIQQAHGRADGQQAWAPQGYGQGDGGQYGHPWAPPPSGRQDHAGHAPGPDGQPGPEQGGAGYGYAPGSGQPGAYGHPAHDEPAHDQPAYGQPAYGQPAYGQPGSYPPPAAYSQPAAYGPPAHGYGQPGAVVTPVAVPPKKQTGLIIGVVSAAVVLALVAVGLFVWPGPLSSKVFDSTQVARGVQEILTDPAPGGYDLDTTSTISGASCPSGQEVRQGATFDCSVQQDGDTKRVRITVLDDDGRYEVSPPQ